MDFAAPSSLRTPSGNPSPYSRRRPPYASQRSLPRSTIVKCQHLPSQNPKPQNNDKNKFSLKSIIKPLAFAFSPLKELLGADNLFLLFGAIALLSRIFVVTKGLSLEEIESKILK